jgi:hypothetical protein
MVAMFAINVKVVYHLQLQVPLWLVQLFFHFNLISGMPFNQKIKASPIISNLAMLSGINFS